MAIETSIARPTTVPALLCLVGLMAAMPSGRAEVLPRAPREAHSRLTLARDAAAVGRYSEAVRALDNLLTGKEDRFVAPLSDGDPWRPLKTEAAALLFSLPPDGRKEYAFFVGSQADRLLRGACRDRDRDALNRLIRQYPGTSAAAEAMYALAYDALDRGRPAEALSWLGRSAATPEALRHVAPDHTLATAAAWLLIGNTERAQQALTRLGSLGSGVRLHVGDEVFTAADDPQRVMVALAGAIRPGMVDMPARGDGWSMFRRDAARQAVAEWSGKVGPTLWKVEAAKEKPSAGQARPANNRYVGQQGCLLPAAHPLVVDSLVLARTAQRLIAIERTSGRQVWEFPWGGDPALADPPSPRFRRTGATTASSLTELQRTFDDAAYGQIATDGRLVFLLDGLSAAGSRSQPVVVMVAGRPTLSRVEPKSHNRLVALQLKKEGKLAWSVGAESGEDEPSLAGAFFLGPPLVDEDRLYVLAEINGEIRLCTLDAASGRLRWSLLLAIPERPLTADPMRRLAGATPSMDRGVLICPTSAGAVVAVDTLTRSILWGHQYPAASNSNRILAMRMAGIRLRGSSQGAITSVDATATICGDRVLLAPVESQELLCLDLHSGGLIWKRTLDNLLFVAAVDGQTVMVVGDDELSAWNLRSGKPAWQEFSVPLPDGCRPSGRGFLTAGRYYLPTTAPGVLAIDVASGRIAERLPMKTAPGNLVALGPLLVSQSPKTIEAFGPAPAKK